MDSSRHQALAALPLKTLQASARIDPVRAWVGLVKVAMQRSGLSQKEAAYLAGISEPQLSVQLSYDGTTRREHLSLWRIHRWPTAFWAELVELLIDFHGLTLGSTDEASDEDLGRAVRALLRGQAR